MPDLVPRQHFLLVWRDSPTEVDARCFDTEDDALGFIIELQDWGRTLNVEFLYDATKPKDERLTYTGDVWCKVRDLRESLKLEAENARVLSSPELTGRI